MSLNHKNTIVSRTHAVKKSLEKQRSNAHLIMMIRNSRFALERIPFVSRTHAVKITRKATLECALDYDEYVSRFALEHRFETRCVRSSEKSRDRF